MDTQMLVVVIHQL